MKTLTITTFAAAALAVAAGSASAQTLKAEIPFAFQTQNTAMPAGTYVVAFRHDAPLVVTLRNADTGAAAMLTQALVMPSRTPAAAKLSFACAGRVCVLREIWNGGGGGYQFLGPKLPRGEDIRIAEIALTSMKAD